MRILFMVLALISQITMSAAVNDVNIKELGAKGNGRHDNTSIINKALQECSSSGGGRVIIPEGTWLTGTIHMQDNVELHLEEGALLQAIDDIDRYESYKCEREDFARYKMAFAAYWNKALILAVGKTNFAITGPGKISGEHVTNPDGEDRIRGPHTLVFAECSNYTLRGFSIIKAGNYAFMGYELRNGLYENLTIAEGYDGIHIRGGKNIIIRNCRIETGDDAIAGGYWENMVITDCHLNSTCNGIRIIYPADDLEICNCLFKGPGTYPHRSVKKLQGKKLMMAAINIQPGAWHDTHGPMQKIHIHDNVMESLRCVLHADLKKSTWGEDMLVERIKATDIYDAAIQLHSWRGGVFDQVTLRDIDVQYVGRSDEAAATAVVTAPKIEAVVLPYWALYVRNVRRLNLENITFRYTGDECRSAVGFDNIAEIVIDNVQAQEVAGKETIVPVNCSMSPSDMLNKFLPLKD